ncbi:hypothetical protein HGRIS_003373 [Hohenbuehelia grisea]|uniref:Uncharacterized protein n=1 Tax=Hohenbuehelia grisea TaxID=104357 RepID=A0ABR3JF96_9AGAR
MVKSSIGGHERSERHCAEVDLQARRASQCRIDEARVQATYSGAAALASSSALPKFTQRPNLLDDISLTRPIDSGPAPEPDTLDYNNESYDDRLFEIPTFITPKPSLDIEAEKARLHDMVAQLVEQATEADELGYDDDATLSNVDLGFQSKDDIMDDDAISAELKAIAPDDSFAPYPNKIMMLLDILDNLPRLRLSSNHFKMILWLLNECNVPGTPSYGAFRRTQSQMQKVCRSVPVQYKSSLGNIFYTNDIRDSVAKDFSNPEVAKHLQLYPEVPDGPISEVWQAERWKEFNPSELTPMYSRGYCHFYIDEAAELDTGEFVMPRNWYTYKGMVYSDCISLEPSLHGWKMGTTQTRICSNRLRFNYLDIVSRIGADIGWAADTDGPPMPNPLRELADGDELYVIMLPIWADDVSGNRSKQYNKHINIYTANGNIPGRLLQEYFVCFISTSPNASSPEQLSAVMDQIKQTQSDPIRCFNAELKRQCRVIVRAPGFPADNPQQSEEASHMGGNANCGCRKCMVGGPYKVTESDEGYHAMFYAGVARSADNTRSALETQISKAMYGIDKPIIDMQTATGIKDKVAQYWIDILLAKSREMKKNTPSRSAEDIARELRGWFACQPGDKINPLLNLAGLDPTQDTPVEILHTILLGIIKYVWYMLHTSWTDTQRDLFVIRLQSTIIDGLNIPPFRAAYMMQYRNGLIGKHFKSLMQTMVFHVHDITAPEQFKLVKAVGALGSILWIPEIDNMDDYLSDLDILIGNVLDAFAAVDPAKILVKIKLHFLPHLISDIRRWGPAIRNSTEIFECYNAIFRFCSVFSNHQAPSRDIANKFASMDRVKHILSGGYWKKDGKWVNTSENVKAVLRDEPIIQRHLGWAQSPEIQSGLMRFAALKKVPLVSWNETKASRYSNMIPPCVVPSDGHANPVWRVGTSVTARSGDACSVGSWVFVDAGENKIIQGRITEMMMMTTGNARHKGLIVLEHFHISERLHPEFTMPVLYRPPALEPSHSVADASTIVCVFSAQHDCHMTGCQPTASRQHVQERQETTQVIKLLEHADDNHFVLNTHPLHNMATLRRILPRALTLPRAYEVDRRAYHDRLAAELRISQEQKRTKANAKRSETRKANLAKKHTQTGGAAAVDMAQELGHEEDDISDVSDDDNDGLEDLQGSKRRRID